ncbi:hypothetical protein AKJ58_00615 [candidate division MSBL1 archaeon SCGC-AAA385D11]|uniref:Uncharacterized protein n=1 Tax=candidate division MSBL1 archaeon SCGC-AAA385D11 TaxID=1698286 RepID=A0A133VP50_9EURY|nr:hypothetical protein AKJ58_00615 [candidate division MSBL1 archaeon SCGC-AAA385D11]
MEGINVAKKSEIDFDVEFKEKDKELPVFLELSLSSWPLFLVNREYEGKITIANELNEPYPDDNHELVIEPSLSTERLDEERVLFLNISNIRAPGHFHISQLKANETRTLGFTISLRRRGNYNIKASCEEREIVKLDGSPQYREVHSGGMIGDKKFCAGEGWQVQYKSLNKGRRWDKLQFRCYSKIEFLLVLGSVAAILAALFSFLQFFF